MTSGPLLSAISLDARTGGIAQVSRMLWRAMTNAWPEARLVRLCPDGRIRATRTDKARFCTRVLVEQMLAGARWVVFTHLDLLRVLSLVPAGRRRPYAVFLHGIEAWGPLKARDERLLAQATLRLANSTFTAERVMSRHPLFGPVVACPLALPLPRPPAEGRERQDVDDIERMNVGPVAVLIVGRMLAAERYKGHDQLIEAWPHVLERVPEAQLIMVGDGDDAERLRGRVSHAGLGDKVIFTGFIANAVLHSLYERCAVFAMPSRGEGFGLVYLEAMAHRLPCVGSRQDAASEIIVDRETGLLVDQHDIPGLADAIVLLLGDQKLRASMGAAGFRRLHERFSLDQFSDRVVVSLREAFEAPRMAGRS